MAAETGSSGAPAPSNLVSRIAVDRGTAIRGIVVAAFIAAGLFAVPALTNAYWELVLLTAGIYTIVALGLALLIGRVGLISLGQVALFAVAGWIALRLGFAASDAAYYRLVIIVGGLMFLLAGLHVRSRAGRAWAAIRQSEAAAMAAGVNITLYKIWALALASFMTGVAGALLVASGGGVAGFPFPTPNSIILTAGVP